MTLTQSDIEQLEALRETNKRGASPTTPNGRVPRETCQQWRERRARGERPVDFVDETEWSLKTVKNHIGGFASTRRRRHEHRIRHGHHPERR